MDNNIHNEYIEFDSDLVTDRIHFQKEKYRVLSRVEQAILLGKTAVVYTKRMYLELPKASKEEKLMLSLAISEGLVDIVSMISVVPKFIIAKGGITSSDVGTKALGVKKAFVLGQIKLGIPVWRTDEVSKFPNIPYVIFPGNVGDEKTLNEIVKSLT